MLFVSLRLPRRRFEGGDEWQLRGSLPSYSGGNRAGITPDFPEPEAVLFAFVLHLYA